MKQWDCEGGEPWGYQAIINIYGCSAEVISSAAYIARFAKSVCDSIDMVAYGEPIITKFGSGDAEGYSLVQLIETSLISAHFSDKLGTAFIDVFSCKSFDFIKVARFAKGLLRGKTYKLFSLERK